MEFSYVEYQNEQLDINIDFCGHEVCPKGYAFGPSVRENFVFHYIIAGKGRLLIEGVETQLAAGDVFILPKDLLSYYKADQDDPWEYVWIGLSGSRVLEYLYRSRLLEKFYLRKVQDSQFAHEFLDLTNSSEQINDPHLTLLLNSKIYRMLYYLAREFPSPNLKVPTQKEQYFYNATKFMANYFYSGITIKNVCQHLSLSRSYLHAIFQDLAGKSPQEYLMYLRMSKAAELLSHSENSIATIAASVGYKDPLTFSKAFKSYYHLAPSEYRLQETSPIFIKK